MPNTSECSSCGQKLTVHGNMTCCINTACDVVLHRMICNWWAWENILRQDERRQFATELIQKHQMSSIANIYKLSSEEFIIPDLVDPKQAQNLFDALKASKNALMWQVLYGLNIPYIGQNEARFLSNRFSSIEQIAQASLEQLVDLEGGDWHYDRANSIHLWFNISANQELIQQLKDAGLQTEMLREVGSPNPKEKRVEKRENNQKIDQDIQDIRGKIERLLPLFIEHFSVLRKWIQNKLEQQEQKIRLSLRKLMN